MKIKLAFFKNKILFDFGAFDWVFLKKTFLFQDKLEINENEISFLKFLSICIGFSQKKKEKILLFVTPMLRNSKSIFFQIKCFER